MKVEARKLFAPVSVLVLILVAAFAFLGSPGTYSGPPAILDPNFEFWVGGPSGTRLMVWGFESTGGYNDNVTIQQSLIQGKSGVGIRVFQSGVGGRLVYADLEQVIDGARLTSLLNASVGIWVLKEPCFCDSNPYSEASVVLAVEVNDGINSISYVFSDGMQGSATFLSHRIIYLPTQSGVWTFQKFSVGREYAAARWKLPEKVTFSIVFGVGKEAKGWHAAYLSSITLGKDQLQNPLPPLIVSVMCFKSPLSYRDFA